MWLTLQRGSRPAIVKPGQEDWSISTSYTGAYDMYLRKVSCDSGIPVVKDELMLSFDPDTKQRQYGEGITDFHRLVFENRNMPNVSFAANTRAVAMEYFALVLSIENRMMAEELFYSKTAKKEFDEGKEPWHANTTFMDKFESGSSLRRMTAIYNLAVTTGDMLEKLFKGIGDSIIATSLFTTEFRFNSGAKKLNQSLGIPREVMKRIGENFPSNINDFQTICEERDGSEAIYLIDFMDKLTNGCKGVDINQKSAIINGVAEILRHKNIPINVLMGYLFRQNYYSLWKSGRNILDCARIAGLTKTLGDTMGMYSELIGEEMKELPSDLEFEHTVITYNYNDMKANEDDKSEDNIEKRFSKAVAGYSDKLGYETKEFIFRAPEDTRDLQREGTLLRHCVASYSDKIADGTIVMFMRQKNAPEKPYCTIEFDYELGVIQAKGFCDADITDANALDAILEWERINKK